MFFHLEWMHVLKHLHLGRIALFQYDNTPLHLQSDQENPDFHIGAIVICGV